MLTSAAGGWKTWVAACAAFVLFVVVAKIRGLDRGPIRVDEAHKISETHYLRLFLQGDFGSQEWFAHIVDRTNPPAGKYYFGAAIALSGNRLPDPPSLSRLATGAHVPAKFSREVSAPYVRYLPATRQAALFATALTAALLVWFAMRISGLLAASVAFMFFITHDLTRAFSATVIFDGLLTLAGVAVVPPVLLLWQRRPIPYRWVVVGAAGVMCGFAVALRLSGAIVVLFAVIALFVDGARRRARLPFVAAVVIGLVALMVVVAVNPYYWAAAPDVPQVAAELRMNEALPLRVVHRFELQLRDLQTIMRGLDRWNLVMWSLNERLRFFGLVMFGDPAGVALWLCITAGLALPLLRKRVRDEHRLLVLWTVIVAGGTALWIPLAWHRYLFVTLPPLTVMAGVGVAEVLDAAMARWRARRTANV